MIDRTPPKVAEQVLNQLLPGATVRRVCTDFLAKSMSLAHSRNRASWGVTLFSDRVRLNVGMIEVFTLSANQIHIIIDSKVLPKNVSERLGVSRSGASYASVSNSVGYNINANTATFNLPFFRKSHEALIRKAASTPRNPATRAAYSPGLTEFLSIGRPNLSHPTYEKGELVVSPDTRAVSTQFLEGMTCQISVNRYERNPYARRPAIEHYGCFCKVCGFDFYKVYGRLGSGFIHVHHLKPLSKIGKKYKVNPIRDLRPICANCHEMIHRGTKMLSIEKLRALIQARKRSRE